jgi:asparagine synthase (glutamine-hydrolysing)
MSGIVGIYYLDRGPIDRENLTKMVDILAHRGSDNADIWVDGCVGFGHRMLWITPESLFEKLPLCNQTGDLVITADARIDNRDELIAALQISNRPSDKITDSELILAAYEKWGEDCPKHLLGDFAFAIWDERKQILFCARDHFGVKPFYYYFSNNTFVFGSEIKAIFCLSEVPRQINEVKVAEYLSLETDDKSITFYKHIFRLPPAHKMTVNCEGIELQRYWSLDSTRKLQLSSDEEYADAFCKLFTEAVRCRLRSAFPVGSMLSGGLDSSSISCVARKLIAEKENRLHTFSAVFDKVTECDERIFQDAVLAQGGFEPHRFHADGVSPLIDLEQVLWHQDEACSAGNLYLNWNLYQPAKKNGVRVILDGFDGDSTVSHGLGYLTELANTEQWFHLATYVKDYCTRVGEPWQGALWSWIRNYKINPVISNSPVLSKVWRGWQKLFRRNLPTQSALNNQPAWRKLINSEFFEQTNLIERLKNQPSPPITERETHYRRLMEAGMPRTLETLDKAAGAYGIELRFPFWDKRLIEFCLSLPPEQKISKGWTRMVMRRAMKDILPQQVQWRVGKTNMHPGFKRGLLEFDQARLEQIILHNPEAIEKYVNITALQQAYQRYLSQEATAEEVNSIWRAVSLALWLEHTDLTTQSL